MKLKNCKIGQAVVIKKRPGVFTIVAINFATVDIARSDLTYYYVKPEKIRLVK